MSLVTFVVLQCHEIMEYWQNLMMARPRDVTSMHLFLPASSFAYTVMTWYHTQKHDNELLSRTQQEREREREREREKSDDKMGIYSMLFIHKTQQQSNFWFTERRVRSVGQRYTKHSRTHNKKQTAHFFLPKEAVPRTCHWAAPRALFFQQRKAADRL